jgi:hypothetical protein
MRLPLWAEAFLDGFTPGGWAVRSRRPSAPDSIFRRADEGEAVAAQAAERFYGGGSGEYQVGETTQRAEADRAKSGTTEAWFQHR